MLHTQSAVSKVLGRLCQIAVAAVDLGCLFLRGGTRGWRGWGSEESASTALQKLLKQLSSVLPHTLHVKHTLQGPG